MLSVMRRSPVGESGDAPEERPEQRAEYTNIHSIDWLIG